MKEWIYGRHAVFETLRAGRRKVYRLRQAQGLQANETVAAALDVARERKVPVEQVQRRDLDGLGENHQGLALQTDEFPYSHLGQLLEAAHESGRPPFF